MAELTRGTMVGSGIEVVVMLRQGEQLQAQQGSQKKKYAAFQRILTRK